MGLLDMIGPVMVGPSSSHTAGACRIAFLARHLLGRPPTRITFGLHGSFAKTGLGHGTHQALTAGVLGFRPDDERIPRALSVADEQGLAVCFEDIELGDVHPNTVRITLENERERVVTLGSSLGGGAVRITSIDGFETRVSGQAPTLLVRHADTPGVIARVARILADDQVNIATLTSARKHRGGEALMAIEMDRKPQPISLNYLHHLSYTYWVRVLPQVMD